MKIEIKYGLYTGIGICLWRIAEHFLGFTSTKLYIGQYSRVFAILLPIVMIPIGIREKRDLELGGTLVLYDGAKCGVAIATIYGAITAAFFFIYQTYINPEYVANLIEFERIRMVAYGIAENDIAGKIEAMSTLNSFPAIVIFHFAGAIVSGLAISIIASALLKRKTADA